MVFPIGTQNKAGASLGRPALCSCGKLSLLSVPAAAAAPAVVPGLHIPLHREALFYVPAQKLRAGMAVTGSIVMVQGNIKQLT